MILLLQSMVWPCFILLLIGLFYRAIRDAVNELPAFIRRSHYGEGTMVASDVSIKNGDVMFAYDAERAEDRIKEMRKENFSACPVLTGDSRFYGVFTIDAWVDYRIAHEESCKDATVADVLLAMHDKSLLVDGLPHTMFVEGDESLRDARIRLKRLGDMGYPLILIVATKNSNVIDMITPFDLLKVSTEI